MKTTPRRDFALLALALALALAHAALAGWERARPGGGRPAGADESTVWWLAAERVECWHVGGDGW